MTTETIEKPPTWYWIVSIVALLWNLAGAMAYVGQAYMRPEDLAALSEAERQLFENQPAWVTGAFAFAVWGGVLGCVFLLLRNKWAKPIFIISFIGIISQMGYNLFMSNSYDVYGPGGLIMPVMVLVIGLGLILFSNKAIALRWLK